MLKGVLRSPPGGVELWAVGRQMRETPWTHAPGDVRFRWEGPLCWSLWIIAGQLHRSPGSGLPRPQGRGGCAGQPDGLFPSTRLHPHRCEDLAPEPSSHLLSHQVIRMPQAGRRGSELLVCHCLAGLWRPGCPAPSPQAFPLPCLCLSVPLSVAPACPSPTPCAPQTKISCIFIHKQ